MYQQAYPVNIASLVTETAAFAGLAGFETVANDTVILKYTTTFNMSTGAGVVGSGYVMAGGLPYSTRPANNAEISCQRVVLKYPGASVYVHMLGYEAGTANREGVIQPVTFIDFYMSAGWAGAGYIDGGHADLIKLGPLYSLPASFLTVYFFGGSDSVHVVIEETAQVYMHFSFGAIEKQIDFTGGQYVTFSCLPIINGMASNSYNYAFSCRTIYSVGSYPGVYGTSVYAPDLDSPNQRPTRTAPYRNLGGHNNIAGRSAGSIIDHGASSVCAARTGTSPISSDFLYDGVLTQSQFPLPNSWSGISPLLPIYAIAHDGNNQNYNNIYGHFPITRHLNLANVNPGDEYALGTDTWKLFPLRAKTSALAQYGYSGNHGYAVKK